MGKHYSGSWVDDKVKGVGRMEYANGDIYMGEWESDQRHGKGKFFSVETNTTYEGMWLNGYKHGNGILYMPLSSTIEGTWRLGAIDGPVVFKFGEGSPWLDPQY